MNIPQGYKQTELGIIPEDWDVVYLKDIAKVNGRIGFRGYTVADLVGAGQGAYAIGGKHISNSIIDLSDAEYISWTKYYESPEIMVKCGDIVMAQRGTLGKSALIDHEIGPATINPSLVLINHIKCNNLYLNYWLQSEQTINAICSLNCQTSIPMITQWQIEHIHIALPIYKKEQQAIAEALSDVDALIATLNKKITKKRLIKQGAMHYFATKQLLSQKVKIGELGKWGKGQSFSKEQILPNGKYKCIHYGELFGYDEVIDKVKSTTNTQPIKKSSGQDILFPASDVTPIGLGRCSALQSKGILLGGDIIILELKNEYAVSRPSP